MLANTQIIKNILTQVKQLSPEYRLRLVQDILQTLVSSTSPISPQSPQPIRFGEFSGPEDSMSTLGDFTLAEWRPTDEELDGP